MERLGVTTVYAPFAVKLASGTTNQADIAITSAGAAGIGDHLTYTIVKTDAWGCDATIAAAGTPSRRVRTSKRAALARPSQSLLPIPRCTSASQ